MAAGATEADRDEPCGAEAAPARRNEQPQRVSPPGRTVTDNAAIKRGFKKAAKATTAEAGLKPSQRRGRGDAGGLFKVAWRALVRRPRPSQSYMAASIFLSEVLDWMNVFMPDTAAPTSEHDGGFSVKHDYLSPPL